MTAKELRKKYIDFFVSKGHVQIAGKSLIPENDPTVLFTTAGMHPLVPYILGEPHPAGKRLTDFQKCIRTGDIDEVGDDSHCTFFEMLGNWSLGDYFKKEAINFSFEFLTSPQWLGIPKEKLSVTAFEGDESVPRDEETAGMWRSLGIPEDRIYFLPRKDNWWGPAGQTGPCGPDTEMFIDTGKTACGPECRPGCHCGKYFEIWNDVFMQYNKAIDSRYLPLEKKTVDTGMGVERTIAMLQGKKTVYDTELFQPIIMAIERITGQTYDTDPEKNRSFRIITDHIRASVFIMADGIKPSNIGQGYILRRLIRRALRHAKKLNENFMFLQDIIPTVIGIYQDVYPDLADKQPAIAEELTAEQEKFGQTLKKGEAEFDKLLPNLLKNPKKVIPGRVAFTLYDTYGFPLEITEELAAEHGMNIDKEGFQEAFDKHKELSKAGSEKTFKGGLADHSDMTKKLHTATHLLHQALRQVLGSHVQQKGSNITSERLRFDFSHPQPMTETEVKQVEDIVNEQITKNLKVHYEIMSLDEARQKGALAFFEQKYEEKVKVYFIDNFSKEVCGGPHVENLSELGHFHIQKEQSSAAGIRRIKAVLENIH